MGWSPGAAVAALRQIVRHIRNRDSRDARHVGMLTPDRPGAVRGQEKRKVFPDFPVRRGKSVMRGP